ncbi:hypothetical protein LCGC14_0834160 [marine sediment metagenome]|uniref:Glycosyltransferase family 1 protein n=1 Tax=marine sediment metagenome TaxID=412755 RepID=A0A0F9Q0C3_9ZZZZ
MKLAVIYNPDDHKLSINNYSQTYKHMLDALIKHPEWDSVQIVSPKMEVCTDVDVIVIYDIHSSYHAEFPNLNKHKALKYTYFNDPHQEHMKGQYKDRTLIHKLGIKERIHRAIQRGVNFIICPYTDGYNHFFAPYLGKQANDMHFWFPVAPKKQKFDNMPLIERKQKILGNGHLWEGMNGFKPYKFRNWAYRRDKVDYVKHVLSDERVPCGNMYLEFLSKWQAGLALTDWYVVPKYLEIPLAGCVCFAQHNTDYNKMGFLHGINYIEVTKNNFDAAMSHFIENVKEYQDIADAGRKLIENNYTSDHFASAVYKHATERI